MPSVLLCIGLGELAYLFAPVRRALARLQHRRAQLAVTAFAVLVLFSAMNAMYGFHGGLRQVAPVALMHNPQRQAARGGGVTLLPLLHLFPDASGYSLHDGIHPDKAGHRRIAGAIVGDLLARGWPPRRSGPRPDQRLAAPNR